MVPEKVPPSDAALFAATREWLGEWLLSRPDNARDEFERARGGTAAKQWIATIEDSMLFHKNTHSIAAGLFSDDEDLTENEARARACFDAGFHDEIRRWQAT